MKDFITTISPGINLTLDDPSQEVSFDYGFQHSFFRNHSDYDFSGHRAMLEARKEFGSPFEVGIREFFTRSDDPIELPGISLFERPSIRDGRRTLYTRNVVEPRLTFRFGEGRSIDLSYRNNSMKNDMSDISAVNPDFKNLAQHSLRVHPVFRLNAHNGLEFYYQYLDQDYALAPLELELDSIAPSDLMNLIGTLGIQGFLDLMDNRPSRDVVGNEFRATYTYHANPILSAFLQYRFYQRNYYDNDFPDYAVHEPIVGITNDFHETASLTTSAGYAYRNTDGQKNQHSLAARIGLSGQYKLLDYDLFGATGFDEDFLSDEALGFYEFWRGGVNARIEQQNTFSAEVFFYIEKDEFHDSIRNDTILNLRTSLSYEILQWLSLAVDYIFFQRNSSETGRSYTDNRVFLRVTAAYDVVEHLQ